MLAVLALFFYSVECAPWSPFSAGSRRYLLRAPSARGLAPGDTLPSTRAGEAFTTGNVLASLVDVSGTAGATSKV
jgi:hypothetical protein